MQRHEPTSPTIIPVIVTTESALYSAVAKAVEEAFRRAKRPDVAPPVKGLGWVTNREAMRLLGLSKPTLARYRADGKLPYAKFGRQVYYRLEDVEAVLAAHSVSKRSGR